MVLPVVKFLAVVPASQKPFLMLGIPLLIRHGRVCCKTYPGNVPGLPGQPSRMDPMIFNHDFVLAVAPSHAWIAHEM